MCFYDFSAKYYYVPSKTTFVRLIIFIRGLDFIPYIYYFFCYMVDKDFRRSARWTTCWHLGIAELIVAINVCYEINYRRRGKLVNVV